MGVPSRPRACGAGAAAPCLGRGPCWGLGISSLVASGAAVGDKLAMIRKALHLSLLLPICLAAGAAAQPTVKAQPAAAAPDLYSLGGLNRITSRFAPADLKADVDKLPDS